MAYKYKFYHEYLCNFIKQQLASPDNDILYSLPCLNDCPFLENCPLNIHFNILNSLPLGIIFISSTGSILYCNQSIEGIINLKSNQIINQHYNNINSNNPIFKLICKLINLSFKGKHNFINQYIQYPAESIYSISAYFINYHDLEEVMIYVQNITNIMKIEKEVIESEKSIIKNQIIEEILHETRNILSNIKVNTQFLKSHLKNTEDSNLKYVDNILKQIDYVKDISNNYLNLIQNTNEIKPKITKIEEIIEEIKFIFIEELKQRNISLNIDYGLNIPPLFIDKNKLKQILINLIKNSIEAINQNGLIKIQTKYQAPDCFKIIINDSGNGIEQEILKKLFQPFFTTKEKGTGLGLSISKRIINNLQGEIEVKSKKNKGTTFILSFPIKYLIKSQ